MLLLLPMSHWDRWLLLTLLNGLDHEQYEPDRRDYIDLLRDRIMQPDVFAVMEAQRIEAQRAADALEDIREAIENIEAGGGGSGDLSELVEKLAQIAIMLGG
jgi:hypothetical protein